MRFFGGLFKLFAHLLSRLQLLKFSLKLNFLRFVGHFVLVVRVNAQLNLVPLRLKRAATFCKISQCCTTLNVHIRKIDAAVLARASCIPSYQLAQDLLHSIYLLLQLGDCVSSLFQLVQVFVLLGELILQLCYLFSDQFQLRRQHAVFSLFSPLLQLSPAYQILFRLVSVSQVLLQFFSLQSEHFSASKQVNCLHLFL